MRTDGADPARPSETADGTEAAEPLVLRTLRPQPRTKLLVNQASNVLLFGVLAWRFRSGAAGRPARVVLWLSAVMLSISVAFNVLLRRSSPGRGRYDDREEVLLPADLVEQVLVLRSSDEPERAVELIRSELDLGIGDTLMALSMIFDTER